MDGPLHIEGTIFADFFFGFILYSDSGDKVIYVFVNFEIDFEKLRVKTKTLLSYPVLKKATGIYIIIKYHCIQVWQKYCTPEQSFVNVSF